MKLKETPWPRLLRAKVIQISERCFSTKPNALFNNRIEIENLEKNSNYYYDCYVHWLLFKNTIKRKRKTKKKSNPTTHIMYEIWMMKWRILIFIHIHMQLQLQAGPSMMLFFILEKSHHWRSCLYIIINTFQFFSPPLLLLSSSLLLSSVIFVADFCLLLSNNADSKTFGTRNTLGNTKRTAGIIIVIVTHKAYDEINT